VAAFPDPAMREVAGDAAAFDEDVTEGVRTALAQRDRLVAAGLQRARTFTWEETARRTAAVYREAIAA
jgi:glycosyltransferase involved in cell wall biosynthesis